MASEVGGFTVIGDVGHFKHEAVKRVLPRWLANPSVVSCDLRDDQDPVVSLGISSHLVSVLQQKFITYFFPVQKQVIPWIIESHTPKLLRPSDLCVSAPTGSGKTLAYVLPIIHVLISRSIAPKIQAIIVLPTEILATQVYAVFLDYCIGTNIKPFLMSKRLSLNSEKRALVRSGANGKTCVPFNIIVTTPGRLIDHVENTEEFDISNLQFLVVDEADRTLDDQQGDWLHRLEVKFWSSHFPDTPQPWSSLALNVKSANMHLKTFHKLLFSATLSQNPETLENLHLFQPKLFTCVTDSDKQPGNEKSPHEISDNFIGKYTTPLELKESFVLCRKETKPLVLTLLIKKLNWKRILCFVNSKENTHRLCMLLKFMDSVKVREISSTWTPQARDLVLKKFTDGQIDMLVTSDQMSRGIDIPSVDYVISYDLPKFAKTYIHRIGRTARAGQNGNAVSLIEKGQIGTFKKIVKKSCKTTVEKISVKNSELKPIEPMFKDALSKLKEYISTSSEKSTRQKAGFRLPS